MIDQHLECAIILHYFHVTCKQACPKKIQPSVHVNHDVALDSACRCVRLSGTHVHRAPPLITTHASAESVQNGVDP